MPKNPLPPKGPEYSRDREFTAILEEIPSDFRAFGEGLADVQEKVSHIPSVIDRIDRAEGKVTMLEMAVSVKNQDLSILKSDVAIIKSTCATKKDLEKIILTG